MPEFLTLSVRFADNERAETRRDINMDQVVSITDGQTQNGQQTAELRFAGEQLPYIVMGDDYAKLAEYRRQRHFKP